MFASDPTQTTPGASLVPGVVVMIDDSYIKQTSGESSGTNSGNDRMSADGQGVAGQSGAASAGGDLFSCLPAPCAQTLRRLRAPALTIRYRMEKQFIPDLDAARGTNIGSCGSQGGGKQQNDQQSRSQDSAGDRSKSGQYGQTGSDVQKNCSGSQPGSMCEQGNLTVRLFDAAVCCVAVLTLVCMTKCCCGMKRMCRRWF